MKPIRFQRCDWADTLPEVGLFDLIIGSDLLYDRDQPLALSNFIDLHSAATVEVLIVDPDRGNQPRFSKNMAGLGYSHTEARVRHLPDGTAYKGRLHSYQRGPLAGVVAESG